MATSIQEHYSLSAPGVPSEVYHPLFTVARQYYDPELVGQWYSQILRQVRGQRDNNPSQTVHGQFSPISPDDERRQPQANLIYDKSVNQRSAIADWRNTAQPEVQTEGPDSLLWRVTRSSIHETSSSPQEMYYTDQAAAPTTTALEVNTQFPTKNWVLPQEVTPQHTPQDGFPPMELQTRGPIQAVGTYAKSQTTTPQRRTPGASNVRSSQWESPQSHMPPPPPRTMLYTPSKVVTPRATPRQSEKYVSPAEDLMLSDQFFEGDRDQRTSVPWLEPQLYSFDTLPPPVMASFPDGEASIHDCTPVATSTGPPSSATFAPTGLGIQDGPSFPEGSAAGTQYYFTESNTAMPILVASDNNSHTPTQSLHPAAALSSVGMRMLMPQDNLYSPPSTNGNPHPRKRKRLLQPAPSPTSDRRRTEQMGNHPPSG